jgi:F-type H+/Na+-transporting ATPase subunit beta
VLLFIDNIFRFTQAGSEVSALLGRMPSAVGYQPTLATEMGELQERITSTKQGLDHLGPGRLRAGRRLHRPRPRHHLRPPRRHHRLSRPSPSSASTRRRSPRLHLAHSRPPSRRRGALQHRPARQADPPALQGPPGHHRHPRHRRTVREDKQTVHRARKIQRFLSQPFHVAEQFTGRKGKYVKLEEPSAPSRKSATASTTTSPNRPSTCKAP